MYLQIVSLVGGRHLCSVYLTSVTTAVSGFCVCCQIQVVEPVEGVVLKMHFSLPAQVNLAPMRGLTMGGTCSSITATKVPCVCM